MTDREQELYWAACTLLDLFKFDDSVVAEDGAFLEALRSLRSAVERYGLPSQS